MRRATKGVTLRADRMAEELVQWRLDRLRLACNPHNKEAMSYIAYNSREVIEFAVHVLAKFTAPSSN